jgi:hypothetical protein
MMRIRNAPWLALALGAVAACAEPAPPVQASLNLDRPVDVAFSCFGAMRVTNGQPADPTQPLVASPMPMTSCETWSLEDDDANPGANIPPGQEPLAQGNDPLRQSVNGYAWILQSVPGTVGIARFPSQPSEDYQGGEVVVLDTDVLTPGKNGISIGSLPVAIATDHLGCHVATANAGSCDLSVLDIASALQIAPDPVVNRVAITDGAGAQVFAKPAAMVARPSEADAAIGVACPALPEGPFFVAFPSCHAVARLDGAGQIQQYVQFAADGTVTVVDDGNLSCPVECGDLRTPPTVGPRPVALDLVHDTRVGTRKLAIGAEDLDRVTVIELDADYRFVPAVEQVPLEGAVGVLDVALSPQIGMGGSDQDVRNDAGAPGGQFQFVYAVATDATVRVAEILNQDRECDTQLDPRFLRDINSPAVLACLPIGDPARPRRAGARGPGIRFRPDYYPLDANAVNDQRTVEVVPIGVTIFGTDIKGDAPDDPVPLRMAGWFAAVTTSNGDVFVVNVDDDKYPDLELASNPVEVTLPLALPHQVRDSIQARNTIDLDSEHGGQTCTSGGPPFLDPPTDSGGPRLAEPPSRFVNALFVSPSKAYSLPSIRAHRCDPGDDSVADRAVSELGFAAPQDVRELAYPDLVSLDKNEIWTMMWEGHLSRDNDFQAIDGPPVRYGRFTVDGAGMRVEDSSHPFCAIGVEPHDIVAMRGCDPALGDGQCATGFTCYVHPDSPQSASGSCLPRDGVDTLSAPCRAFLLSARRYSVRSSASGELRLAERPRVLRTTPVTGCTSDAHCDLLADVEAGLASDAQPGMEPPAEDLAWSCRPDSSRNGTQNRCVLTCDPAGDGSDCDAESVCNAAGICVEGIVPPLQCVEAPQRYELRGGDAFIVTGSAHGYQHSIIEDPATGACVPDPDAHPLMIGRFPLDAPPCSGDAATDLLPNPCEVVLEHTFSIPLYTPGTCELGDPETMLVTENVTAIRFQNPQLRFHLVQPTYNGDLTCKGDRMGMLGEVPTVYPTFRIELHQVDGLMPLHPAIRPTFPTRVVKGPQNSVWVVDEGDGVTGGNNATLGRVFRVEANDLTIANVLQ